MKSLLGACRNEIDYYLNELKILPLKGERDFPVNFQFSLHTEEIAIAHTFKKFLKLIKEMNGLLGTKPLCCVTTPENIQTRYQMQYDNCDDKTFICRLQQLSEYAEIGYHGHFFIPELSKDEAFKLCHSIVGEKYYPAVWNGDSSRFDEIEELEGVYLCPWDGREGVEETIKSQMDQEIQWLRSQGYNVKHFVGGGWHLHPVMVEVLEKNKFLVDTTYRSGHPRVYGQEKYGLPSLHRGEFGVLKGGLKEIHSIFFPVSHPQTVRESYLELMKDDVEGPKYVVFPGHEVEIIDREKYWKRHVKFIHDTKHFKFFDWEMLK